MKRDWKLIELILSYAEAKITPATTNGGVPPPTDLNGFNEAQIDYHISLCYDAGYLIYNDHTYYIEYLTWKGHDKLDELRNK